MAAVATGGIHLTRPAVLIGAAALAMFAIWQAGANRGMARRIAGGPVWGILRVAVMVTFSVFDLYQHDRSEQHFGSHKTIQCGLHRRYYGASYGAKNPPPPPIRAKALVEFHTDPYWDWVLRLSWYIPVGLLFVRWRGRSRWGGGWFLMPHSVITSGWELFGNNARQCTCSCRKIFVARSHRQADWGCWGCSW